MKTHFIKFLFIFVFSACSVKPTKWMNDQKNTKNYFPDKNGCFLLFNMKSKKFEKVIGEENCQKRFVTCSTFKVPLAIMAFDSGVLKDENQVLKFDGEKNFFESDNHDHSAKTWLKNSVV